MHNTKYANIGDTIRDAASGAYNHVKGKLQDGVDDVLRTSNHQKVVKRNKMKSLDAAATRVRKRVGITGSRKQPTPKKQPVVKSGTTHEMDPTKPVGVQTPGKPFVDKPSPGMSDSVYKGIAKSEGGTTTDSGGFTRGGVAESSGKTKKQIMGMSKSDIKDHWSGIYSRTGANYQDPGMQDIATHVGGMMGGPQYANMQKRILNEMNPNAKPLHTSFNNGAKSKDEDFNYGKTTRLHTAAVDTKELRKRTLDEFAKFRGRLETGESEKAKVHRKSSGGVAKRIQLLRDKWRDVPVPAKVVKPTVSPMEASRRLQGPAMAKAGSVPLYIKRAALQQASNDYVRWVRNTIPREGRLLFRGPEMALDGASAIGHGNIKYLHGREVGAITGGAAGIYGGSLAAGQLFDAYASEEAKKSRAMRIASNVAGGVVGGAVGSGVGSKIGDLLVGGNNVW